MTLREAIESGKPFRKPSSQEILYIDPDEWCHFENGFVTNGYGGFEPTNENLESEGWEILTEEGEKE